MPSTVGHMLAGATIAWVSDATLPGRSSSRGAVARHTLQSALQPTLQPGALTLTCAGIAAAPDLDLILRTHRTYTHSIGATAFVALFAAAMAAYARLPIARVAVVCAAAHFSHLVLDWLAADRVWPYGIQAFWPFSREYYISGLDLFRQTARRHFFSEGSIRANLAAVAQELLILGPPALAVWLIRVKALAGLATEVARGDHAAQ